MPHGIVVALLFPPHPFLTVFSLLGSFRWRPDFPRPELPEDTPLRERIAAYHAAHFDFKQARMREKAIFQAETIIWNELFVRCEERNINNTDKTRICKPFKDAYLERVAYEKSDFSAFRVPTLTPGLPDLGKRPVAPQVKDPELRRTLENLLP